MRRPSARVRGDLARRLPNIPKSTLGKVCKRTDPLGRETKYTYGTGSTPDADCATGTGIDLLKVEQKNGANYELLESRTYNSQHRPLTVTDAAGQTTTATYNAQGQIATITTPPRAGITENRTTTFTYDPNGYLQSETGPATGATTNYTYDGYGRLRTITDPEGYTVTYDYDVLDRATKVTYPDASYQQIVYNRLDAEQYRDRLGRWSHTFFDALRRAVAIRDPLGRTTTQQWCNCGSLDKIIDANQNATSWDRDLQGRVTKETRADGSFKTFVYETTNSRLKSATDAKNQTITSDYFSDNALKQVTYTNAQNATPNVSFTYDPVYPRVATMIDGTGTTSYSYNAVTAPASLGAARLSSINGPLTNDTITYTYDELSRVVSRAINGTTASQTFDVLSRLASKTNPLGSFTLGYVGVTSRLASLSYPNGQATNYAYFDNAGQHRLQEIKNLTPAAAVLSKFNYTYDATGSITSWSQQRDTNPAKVLSFGYDPVGQLRTGVRTPPDPGLPNRFGYAYDNVGNRTAEQLDDAVVAGTYNNVNWLMAQQPGGALRFVGTVNEPATVTVGGKPALVGTDNTFQGTAAVPSGTSTVGVIATDASGNVRTNTYQVSQSGAAKTLTYDANGDLTSDGTRTFSWDAANRLLTVDQGTLHSEFSYNGNGERARIVEKDGTTTLSDRRYVWCDGSICEERDTGGSTVTRRFYDEGMQEGSTSYFYTRDHLGSVREMTDSAGSIRTRYEYDPYGRITQVGGDKAGAFGFTGHFIHAPSGLALAKWRAYDPGAGRWINEDPIGLEGGINLYAYVSDDPLNATDPLGLILWKCSRQSQGALAFANHVYFCDPHTGRNCGKGKQSSGGSRPSGGPCPPTKNEVCVPIPGTNSQTTTNNLIACCASLGDAWPNNGFGPFDTCHEYLENCLTQFNLPNPPTPGGKFGCRTCDPNSIPKYPWWFYLL